jgi:hypothetical protein
LLEGVDGEKGSGYSKKEAQQLASKDTLQRLKREPQFIDAIFAAKTERTKMEEVPAMAVPDTEQEQEFIVSSRSQESGDRSQEDTPAADSSVQGNLTPHSTLHTPQNVDYRSAIRPKNPEADPDFESRPYYQVWQQKNGFLANLSILDLLFNMGNESVFYL